MSDTIHSIYADYDLYIILCEKYRQPAYTIHETDKWLEHFKQLNTK